MGAIGEGRHRTARVSTSDNDGGVRSFGSVVAMQRACNGTPACPTTAGTVMSWGRHLEPTSGRRLVLGRTHARQGGLEVGVQVGASLEECGAFLIVARPRALNGHWRRPDLGLAPRPDGQGRL